MLLCLLLSCLERRLQLCVMLNVLSSSPNLTITFHSVNFTRPQTVLSLSFSYLNRSFTDGGRQDKVKRLALPLCLEEKNVLRLQTSTRRTIR